MNQTYIFLRVENDNGEGPYTLGHCREVCIELGDSDLLYDTSKFGRHPSPCDDSLFWESWIGIEGRALYRFGFHYAHQYRSWFYNDEALAKLRERGFKLSVYAVDDCIVGHTQMAAKATGKYELLGRYDLLTHVASLDNIVFTATFDERQKEKARKEAAKKAEHLAKRRAQYAAKKAQKATR